MHPARFAMELRCGEHFSRELSQAIESQDRPRRQDLRTTDFIRPSCAAGRRHDPGSQEVFQSRTVLKLQPDLVPIGTDAEREQFLPLAEKASRECMADGKFIDGLGCAEKHCHEEAVHYQLESFLLREREWLYAGGNILLSVLLCMVAVWLGFMLGSTFNSMKGN